MLNALSKMPSLSCSVNVTELQRGQEGEWDEFVMSSPSGTFFHLSGWMSVVETVLGYRCFRFVARHGNHVTGVFPITWVRNPVFGDCLVSLPLAVYGGICANDEDSYQSLLKAGADLSERLGVKYLEMRNQSEPYLTSLPGRDLYVSFSQDLSAGPAKLLQGLPRDTRYMVRKSLKAGLDWTEDIGVDEFYDVYARAVHHLGTPVFPKQLFDQLQHTFPGSCRIFGVRKGKQVIAGVLCFYFRDQVLPYYGGSLAEFNRDAPNNFMYWSLISQSCKEGIRHFDFGRSKKGTGSYDFKSSWSMRVTELPYRYHLVRAREIPRMTPVDKRFQLPVAAWKRMPFSWTKVIGPRVIRWIPSI